MKFGLASIALFTAGSLVGCVYSTAALATVGGWILAQRLSSYQCGVDSPRNHYEETLA